VPIVSWGTQFEKTVGTGPFEEDANCSTGRALQVYGDRIARALVYKLVIAHVVINGRLHTTCECTGLLQGSWACTALSSRAIKFKQLPLPAQDPRDRQVCARNQVWGTGSPYNGVPLLLTPALVCSGIASELAMEWAALKSTVRLRNSFTLSYT
jgi:hypothetical protein